jgi:hypothetical protein
MTVNNSWALLDSDLSGRDNECAFREALMRPSSRPRKIANLSESVHQHLNMYALAAGAAGVGLAALAQPCEARIVYRHVRVVISPNSHFDLDLNHDGFIDFSIQNIYKSNTSYKVASLRAHPAQSANTVEGKLTHYSGGQPWVFALRRGARIGPAKQFSGSLMAADSLNNFGGAKGYWWSGESRVSLVILDCGFRCMERPTTVGRG